MTLAHMSDFDIKSDAAVLALPPLPAWMSRADCKDLPLDESTRLFFPRSTRQAVRVAPEVQALCGGCSVQAQCVEFSVDERGGTWGGVTEIERYPRTSR